MSLEKQNSGWVEKELSDDDLLRFSRQIFLPEVGVDGQQKLNQAHVVIVGVGGLGSISAPLLAASGVGKITLVDFDHVDASNLPRQIFYRESDVGQLKVECLAAFIQQQNSQVKIGKISKKLNQNEFQALFESANLVLDGTDNFATRHLVNRACFAVKTPLLSAAVSQFSGQIILFDYKIGSPCYECLYSDDSIEENNCAENGIMGPAASMVASSQAMEAQKFLIGMTVSSLNTLISYDMKLVGLHKATLSHDENCIVCGDEY